MPTLTDTFTDAAGTPLDAHAPDTGGAWVKQAGFTDGLVVSGSPNADQVRAAAVAFCAYRLNAPPPAADYSVAATFTFPGPQASAAWNFGLTARASGSATTFYWFVYNFSSGSGSWSIQRVVAGSFTTLWQSSAVPLAAGSTYAMQGTVSGTNLSLSVNGTPVGTATDGAITGAGFAGLLLGLTDASDRTGVLADNFAVAALAGSPTPTPTPTVTITPTAGNWSDNGYGTGTANYVQTGEFARLDVTTDATAVAVTAYTDAYAYPNITTIGYRVNGGAVQVLTCTAAGSSTFNVTLPGVAGTVVEFINGAQILGGSNWVGTYVTSLAFTGGTAATVVAPAAEPDKLLVYADSIAGGGNLPGTPPAAWPQQVRDTYGHVQVEAYGGRRLWNDCPTQSAAQAFAAHLAAQSPAKLISAIGINDKLTPGFPSLAAYTVAYGWMLDAFHALAPTVPVAVVSPLITNGSEGANSQGDTLPAYRTAVAGLATGRPWLTVVDGSTILSTADIGPNDVHPTAAGQVKLAAYYFGLAGRMAGLTLGPATIPAGSRRTVTVSGTALQGRFAYAGTAGASVEPCGPATTIGNRTVATLAVRSGRAGTLTVTDAGGASATLTIVPARPAAAAVVPTSGSAAVTWAATPGAATYRLTRTPTAGGPAVPVYAGPALTAADTGLANGTAYAYAVVAVDADGNASDPSPATTATPTVPDPFAGTSTGLDGPYTRDANVTPSDSVDLPFETAAISVTAAGTVSVKLAGAATPAVLSATPGTLLKVRATRVYATGTTATGIVALA